MRGEELFEGCLVISPQADLVQATRDMPSTAGTCLFANEENQPILLLYGANLRALVRRRLADEETQTTSETKPISRRTRLRPIVTRIWFRRTYSAFETQLAYFRIAREVYPDSYQEWFGRLEAWFLHFDSAGAYPVWEVTHQLTADIETYWGPFATKKTAGTYLEVLQSMFDLCRCPERIGQGDCTASCTYAQMNRCGAMEQGTFSPEKHLTLNREATDFLRDIPQHISVWQEQMQQRSAERQFEQAQRLKDRVDRAQTLLSEKTRWVMPLDQFYVFSFQPGPKRKTSGRKKEPTLSGFLLSLRGIDQIEPIPLSEAAQAAQALLDHLHLTQLQTETTAKPQQSELFSWATRILYKKNQDKNLFLRARDDLATAEMAQRIEQHFSQPARIEPKLKLDNLSLTEHKGDDLGENDPEKKS
jgi:hypothetical protein